MFTKEELTPHALTFFSELKKALPPLIAARLRSNAKVVTHGSFGNLFLFDIWDANQTDVIGRKHFKYCLAYDPSRKNAPPADGYFHLWLNTVRIYRQRESIKATLESTLPKLISTDFKYERLDRAISAGQTFHYPKKLEQLAEILVPPYVRLITAVHPLLIPIIDQFTSDMADGERREVVAKRGKIAIAHPGVRDRTRIREYTRSVPASWKPLLLEKYRFRCKLCGADLRKAKVHFDHILAFSRGGPTVFENLRPICSPCNLKKGNRDDPVAN